MIEAHRPRVEAAADRISYHHRGVRLQWVAGVPHVFFTAPDVHAPADPPVEFIWWHDWEDDWLLAAAAGGATDDLLVGLAFVQAHFAVASLALHEVGEWFTFRGKQVFPPHRPDPYIPVDEDRGPDGNGAVVLWLDYPSSRSLARRTQVEVVHRLPPHLLPDPGLLGSPPGYTLDLAVAGITIRAAGTGAARMFPWSCARSATSPGVPRAVTGIHAALAHCELDCVAENVLVDGERVLTSRRSGAGARTQVLQVPWRGRLSYDG